MHGCSKLSHGWQKSCILRNEMINDVHCVPCVWIYIDISLNLQKLILFHKLKISGPAKISFFHCTKYTHFQLNKFSSIWKKPDFSVTHKNCTYNGLLVRIISTNPLCFYRTRFSSKVSSATMQGKIVRAYQQWLRSQTGKTRNYEDAPAETEERFLTERVRGFNFPISRTVTLSSAAVRPEYSLPVHQVSTKHDDLLPSADSLPGLFKIPTGAPSSVLKITPVRLVFREARASRLWYCLSALPSPPPPFPGYLPSPPSSVPTSLVRSSRRFRLTLRSLVSDFAHSI